VRKNKKKNIGSIVNNKKTPKKRQIGHNGIFFRLCFFIKKAMTAVN